MLKISALAIKPIKSYRCNSEDVWKNSSVFHESQSIFLFSTFLSKGSSVWAGRHLKRQRNEFSTKQRSRDHSVTCWVSARTFASRKIDSTEKCVFGVYGKKNYQSSKPPEISCWFRIAHAKLRRSMCRYLKRTLREKFPQVPKKVSWRVVKNSKREHYVIFSRETHRSIEKITLIPNISVSLWLPSNPAKKSSKYEIVPKKGSYCPPSGKLEISSLFDVCSLLKLVCSSSASKTD